MTTTTNCPHCGAGHVKIHTANECCPEFYEWGCGTTGTTKEGTRSDLCRERAARQKAEAELKEAKSNAELWREQSERWEKLLLDTGDRLAETRKELAEALRKVVEAAGLISRLMPYLRHQHPRCVAKCECGLNKIIMEAGKAAGVVATKAKEGK